MAIFPIQLLNRAIEELLELCANFERRGFNWEQDVDVLQKIYGFFHLRQGFPFDYLMHGLLSQDAQACEKLSLKPEEAKREVVEMIGTEIKRIAERTSDVAEMESKRADWLSQAGLVPSAEVLDRLCRCESHLHRLFERTLARFEHLKCMRLGLAVPPTIKISHE